MTGRDNTPIPPPGTYGTPQAQPPHNNGKRKMSIGAKVAIGLSIVMVVLLAIALLTIASFMRSCDASLNGTEEVHDTHEVVALLGDLTVAERDLEIFDILRPGFECMHLDSKESIYGERISGEEDAAEGMHPAYLGSKMVTGDNNSNACRY